MAHPPAEGEQDARARGGGQVDLRPIPAGAAFHLPVWPARLAAEGRSGMFSFGVSELLLVVVVLAVLVGVVALGVRLSRR